mgnify:CR=1 FL=1
MTEQRNNNMVKWILGLIILLVFGAYGYTTYTVSRSEDRLFSRIDRLEDTIRRELKEIISEYIDRMKK